MKKMFVAVLTALMLTACGVSVDAGNVSDKRTEEVEVTERVCEKERKVTGSGKNKKTKTVQECEDEPTGEFETKYYVTLKDKDGNSAEHEVTVEQYEELNDGDFLDTNK